jgi:hypothetical protein
MTLPAEARMGSLKGVRVEQISYAETKAVIAHS